MDDLVTLEQAGWDSLCAGTGAAFYGSVMIENGLMVLAGGEVMTRSEVTRALSDAAPWVSYRLDDLRHVPIDEDTAALVYVGTAWRDQQSAPFVAAMSSVYVRQDGAWRLALYQQTARPDTNGSRQLGGV